ncbi:MAG: 50S ribosomal protein L11 methyltransferase [Pyrinomonadaceae bacterium]|nr:50S ribosomal protein L11 methyltransferase [Pyrinomonadaceae bacterium]MCX7640314.1 50S ribosomal protein L11 methyltransferase [Pyrinomonadaceae bacterium]MDW8304741.1 50S ribosomal protein L11 methyltransferase [Acidobacteriota bacterium]
MKSASQDNKKSWDVFEVETSADATEAVEFGLNEAESLGTEIDNLGKKQSETLLIKGYFEKGKKNKKAVLEHLEKALKVYGMDLKAIQQVRKKTIIEKDWLKIWKKHWKPVETEKFIISPPWEKIEKKDKKTIYIEPATAFGTGTHETTRLCLRAIERFYEPEMSFFDVGTGTGILAIAVAKLSGQKASKILACDVDEESIIQARKNAVLNKIENIEFFLGSINSKSPALDFVCVNISLEVILPQLPLLARKANKILVLSGILKDQKEKMREALLKLDYKNYEIEVLNDWLSIVIHF